MTDETVEVDRELYERMKREFEQRKNHNVNESADKIRLDTKVKRGSDVRNEDVVKVQVKDNHPEKAAKKLADTLEALEKHGVADTLRDTQPGEDE